MNFLKKLHFCKIFFTIKPLLLSKENDIFEEFINLLDVLSLEPFPWKLLKNTIPIVDKNFPPGSRLI